MTPVADLLPPLAAVHGERRKAAIVLARLADGANAEMVAIFQDDARLAGYLGFLSCRAGCGPLTSAETSLLAKLHDDALWSDLICAIGLGHDRNSLPVLSDRTAVGQLISMFGAAAVTFAFTFAPAGSRLTARQPLNRSRAEHIGRMGVGSALKEMSPRLSIWQSRISQPSIGGPVDGQHLRSVAALAFIHFKILDVQ